MSKSIQSFQKTKEYLVCIDSDGCAIDSMTVKHKLAFGPALIDTFDLTQYRDEMLAEWMRINLYSMTRGINRFKGLNMALHYCNDNFTRIENIEDLDCFCNQTKAFSNEALIEYKNEHPSKLLDMCLKWSVETNRRIKAIPDKDIGLFKNVKESIASLAKFANIAVVSSANFDAIWKEWERLGILNYVDCFCSQHDGTKALCIQSLLFKGYKASNVVMIGDSPGDLDAAFVNGVYFYPIVCKHEEESWEKSLSYIDNFDNNTIGEHQEELVDAFKNNLKSS